MFLAWSPQYVQLKRSPAITHTWLKIVKGSFEALSSMHIVNKAFGTVPGYKPQVPYIVIGHELKVHVHMQPEQFPQINILSQNFYFIRFYERNI